MVEPYSYYVAGSLSQLYRTAFLYEAQLAQDKLTPSLFFLITNLVALNLILYHPIGCHHTIKPCP